MSKVAEIAHQYTLTHIGADDPRRSVDLLRDTVQTYLGVRVHLFRLPVSAADSVVHGSFAMKPNGEFDICFADGLTIDWLRFVVCKELFHIIIDQESFHDMDIAAHVEALTVAFPDDDSTPRPSVLAEFLAEIAAMEFLFPWAKRRAELVAAGSQRPDIRTILTKYGVPPLMAERYLSDQFIERLDPAVIDA